MKHLIIFSLVIIPLLSFSQSNFNYTVTNISGVFLGIAEIDGISANGQDTIGAFDAMGNCVGASVLTINNNIAYINLVIYGDDPSTPTIDEGMSSGEIFYLKLWDSSSNQLLEYPNATNPTTFTQWQSTNGAIIPAYSNFNQVYNFITTSTLIVGNIQVIQPSCINTTNGSIDITVSGGAGGYSYLWSNGDTTEDLTNIGIGNYNCFITDANGDTINTANISLSNQYTSDTVYVNTYTCDTTQIGIYTNIYTNLYGCDSLVIDTVSLDNSTNCITQIPTFNFTVTNSSGILLGVAQINGNPASSGDTIAAFSQDGNCVGANAVIMNNGIAYINLVIYGDDPVTTTIDEGMNVGEYFTLKLYDSSEIKILDYPISDNITQFTQWQNTNGTPISAYSNFNDVYNFLDSIPINILSTAITNESCQNSGDGMIDITVTGGNGGYFYSWSNGATTEDISNITTGVYYVTITDTLGVASTIDSFYIAYNYTLDTTYISSTSCDVNQIGVFSTTLSNQNGCDSTVINTVSLLPSDSTFLSSTTCDISQNGTFTTVLSNQFGCDSIVVESIGLLLSDTTYIQSYSCDINNIGLFTYQLTNYNGCDSVVYETISLIQSFTNTFDTTICSGESVLFGGITYSASGSYTDSLQTSQGCDSIVILNLTVNPNSNSVINEIICQGQSYNFGGFLYSVSGTYIDSLQTSQGCDSIITLNLTVQQNDTTNLTVTTCDITQIGITSQLYSNTLGCDSIVIINTVLTASNNTDIYNSSCNPLDTGVVTIIYTNQFGCDSIVTITTTLLPSPVVLLTPDTTVCTPSSLTLQVSGGVNFTWSSNVGALNINDPVVNVYVNSITPVVYSVNVTNSSGCSVLDSVIVSIHDTISPVIINNNDTLSVFPTGTGYTWFYSDTFFTIPSGSHVVPNTIGLSSIVADANGYYRVRIADMNGCEYESETENIMLVNSFSQLGLTDNISIYPNPNNGFFTIKWEDTKIKAIRIWNSNGQLEYFHELNNQIKKYLNINNLEIGLHFIQLIDEKGKTYIYKIIVN